MSERLHYFTPDPSPLTPSFAFELSETDSTPSLSSLSSLPLPLIDEEPRPATHTDRTSARAKTLQLWIEEARARRLSDSTPSLSSSPSQTPPDDRPVPGASSSASVASVAAAAATLAASSGAASPAAAASPPHAHLTHLALRPQRRIRIQQSPSEDSLLSVERAAQLSSLTAASVAACASAAAASPPLTPRQPLGSAKASPFQKKQRQMAAAGDAGAAAGGRAQPSPASSFILPAAVAAPAPKPYVPDAAVEDEDYMGADGDAEEDEEEEEEEVRSGSVLEDDGLVASGRGVYRRVGSGSGAGAEPARVSLAAKDLLPDRVEAPIGGGALGGIANGTLVRKTISADEPGRGKVDSGATLSDSPKNDKERPARKRLSLVRSWSFRGMRRNR